MSGAGDDGGDNDGGADVDVEDDAGDSGDRDDCEADNDAHHGG